MAPEITYSNFEISLVVFVPNITTKLIMLLPIQIKSKPRIKLNHNTKKIINHFSGCVSKDVLYWSTVLTMCKHGVG